MAAAGEDKTAGGFGGGSGENTGGGGLGAGGDIFVEQGGSLTIEGGTLNAGTVTRGVGANPGQAYGSGIFIQGTRPVILAPGAGQTLTISGVIADMTGSHDPSGQTGAGSLIINGPGLVVLAASNTFTGGIQLEAGTLAVGTDGALGSGTLAFASGTTLQAAANGVALANNMTLSGTDTVDTQGNALTLSGILSGAGSLTETGGGTLTLTDGNTYEGGTTVTGGLINFNSAGNFGSGTITLDGGGLQWAAGNTIDISADLTAFGSAGATFDLNGNNVALTSVLSGAGGLTETGAGTLTLTAVNNYTGGTIVDGALELGNPDAAGSGTITLASVNASLEIAGTTMPTNAISGFAPGSTIDLQAVSYIDGSSATVLNGNVLQVTVGSQAYNLNLDPSLNWASASFGLCDWQQRRFDQQQCAADHDWCADLRPEP